MDLFTDNGNDPDGPVLILAHGAGAPADSAFMTELARGLNRHGVTTVRFEFPYMAQRRRGGNKRPPDRQAVLIESYERVLDDVANGQLAGRPLFIGGKSMGGRMATMLAADSRLRGKHRGAIAFGYPFHPPGKPDRWRIDHFSEFWCPVGIVQGSRDPFGKREEVERELAPGGKLEWLWLEGGDHDFQPLARQPESRSDLVAHAADWATSFMKREVASVTGSRKYR
ncbi:alpha/beta fold hydrolase [Marinobacter sp.]|uniref:alpha/beta fold hydrolase n=1 Tax=Marinobacter sp. TaxID=50741 RepID=UPI0034A181C6